ncbi:MAG TPA: SBBP repeat-containing protein, partial [Candidatus Kapabacteria bacterium]|nr:SBBP repeat-containing protein [Candidatus Kapabacteria bacterium]
MAAKKNIVLFFIVITTGLIWYHGDTFAAGSTTDSLTWLWAHSGGGPDNEGPWKVAVDSSGNVYTIGWFPGTISFGSINLTSAGDWDVFLVKYNAVGNLLWAKRYGGSGKEEGLGLTIDKNGNLYIAGYFMGTTTFGSYTVTSRGDRDIFIAKCDSNGNVIWFVSDGG